jgi:hypothetical protein
MGEVSYCKLLLFITNIFVLGTIVCSLICLQIWLDFAFNSQINPTLTPGSMRKC